jgi:hypothetical protein
MTEPRNKCQGENRAQGAAREGTKAWLMLVFGLMASLEDIEERNEVAADERIPKISQQLW